MDISSKLAIIEFDFICSQILRKNILQQNFQDIKVA